MERRVVVTGSNGFVGREAVGALVQAGAHAVGLVRSEAAAAAIVGLGGEARVVSGLHTPEMASAFVRAAAVVHLAQIGSEHGRDTFDSVNVNGTRAVARAAAAAGVRRVVFLSGLGVAGYGLKARCTNRYFLSKLRSELELYGAVPEVVTLRPSYLIGAGDGLITQLQRELAERVVEWPGDGRYRMQPAAVQDAGAAVAAAALQQLPGVAGRTHDRVIDLVGPEPIAYRDFVARVAARTRRTGFEVRSVPIEEVDRLAAGPGGYRGLPPEDVDCLLCDEVSDHRPLEGLLGRPLTSLDQAIDIAVRHAAA